ncbi:MAG TPA: hypothetical protein VMV79_02970 [Alphaproteobacteria bacterium]|nr:hypothetical protein [Alphaproteobacteria bacterium]
MKPSAEENDAKRDAVLKRLLAMPPKPKKLPKKKKKRMVKSKKP